MFNVGIPIAGGPLNGRDVMVMQSQSDADFIIREFRNRYIPGVDAKQLINEICDDADIDQDTMTDHDIDRVVRELKSIVRTRR